MSKENNTLLVETIGFLIAFPQNLTPFLYPTGRQKI